MIVLAIVGGIVLVLILYVLCRVGSGSDAHLDE
jgi:hypothetical protein